MSTTSKSSKTCLSNRTTTSLYVRTPRCPFRISLSDCGTAAEASQNNKKATQEDISRVIQSLKLRDDKILAYEAELRRVADEYRRLREELLPVFRMAKERSQPLPDHASSPDFYHSHDNLASPVLAQPPLQQQQQSSQQDKQGGGGSGLARKISHKGKNLWLNSTPKNASPTYMPQAASIPEGKMLSDGGAPALDPSAAALAASSHLTASLGGPAGGGPSSANSPNPAGLPSPTSPHNYHGGGGGGGGGGGPTSASTRGYGRDADRSAPSTGRSQYGYGDELPQFGYSSTASTASTLVDGIPGAGGFRGNPTPTPGRATAGGGGGGGGGGPRGGPGRDQDDSPSSAGRGEAPSVEIFKSFRVSMEDPCYKVLPAALKKYNINADWRQYALYIVYGDQERCLGLEEKPLILFKQLDKEGRKPMFMLRRHAAPVEGHSGPTGAAMMGFEGGGLSGGGRAHQSSIQLPGGVL